MKIIKWVTTLLFICSTFYLTACQEKPAEKEKAENIEAEESGVQLALNDTYDSVRNGVRLILNYDSESSSFVGTVENITKETIKSVSVEVQLSNGVELGPTNPFDLAPGKKVNIGLSAEGQTFEWFKAHPEAGLGDHEGDDEHEGKEGEKGEHDGEDERGEHD